MADRDDHDHQLAILKLRDHAIVPEAPAPKARAIAAKRLAALPRIIERGNPLHSGEDALRSRWPQFSKLFPGWRFEFTPADNGTVGGVAITDGALKCR